MDFDGDDQYVQMDKSAICLFDDEKKRRVYLSELVNTYSQKNIDDI